MLKHLARFVGSNHPSTLEAYSTVIRQSKTPLPFRSLAVFAISPLLVASSTVAFGPHLGIITSTLPVITEYTFNYAAILSTYLAGIHLGLAATFYEPNLTEKEGRYFKLQMLYPFVVPFFGWMFCCHLWAVPYTHIKSLNSLAGIGVLYVGTMIGDALAVESGTVPKWFRYWKTVMTVGSIISVLMLIYGVYFFPEITMKPRAETEVKTIKELYEENN